LSTAIKHVVIVDSLHKDQIPSSVEILEFKCKYHCIKLDVLQESIPKSIKTIILGTQSLLNAWFITQQTLSYFNETNLLLNNQVYQIYDAGNIPISISTTVVLWRLNQSIQQGVIPYGVNRIVFGHQYNQPILPNTIPDSVTEINFGNNFNQSLSTIHFPINLKYLTFNQINQPILPFSLPPSLLTLYIKRYASIYHESLIHIPKSIRYCKIGRIKCKQEFNNDTDKFKFKSIYLNPSQQDLSTINDFNNSLEQYEEETILFDQQKQEQQLEENSNIMNKLLDISITIN